MVQCFPHISNTDLRCILLFICVAYIDIKEQRFVKLPHLSIHFLASFITKLQHDRNPRLTWAGLPDTVSVGRSRQQPRLWSRCRRRTASLSCPTRPGWAWPRFYSAERVPTLLVNPPIWWANTKGAKGQTTISFFNFSYIYKHHALKASLVGTYQVFYTLCKWNIDTFKRFGTQLLNINGNLSIMMHIYGIIAIYIYTFVTASHVRSPDMNSKQKYCLYIIRWVLQLQV